MATALPSPDLPRPPVRPGIRRALRWLPAAALVLFLALFPALVDEPFPVQLGVILFLAVLQGSAWNLVGGYAGQHSLGHAAYFGAGAYTAAVLLERFHLAPFLSLPFAAVSAVLVALAVGGIALRLRGPSFVLASLAVAEILRLAALHFRQLTHGAEGIAVAGEPAHVLGMELGLALERPAYYLTLALAVVAVGVSWAVRRSRLGYRLLAIREDQGAAHSLGIRPALATVALAISAALTGVAGAVFAGYSRFVDPGAFGIGVSVRVVLVCVLGGIGTVEGPIIGALLLVLLDELVIDPRGLVGAGLLPSDSELVGFMARHLPQAQLLVHGLLLVAILLLAPEGVAGLLRRLARGRGAASAAAPAP